jgi:uncharacterized protein (TIGR02266 family)
MSEERRAHPRTAVSLKVSYLSKGDLQDDLVTDVSPGGLFVRTSKPLAIGTEVDLEVQIAEDEAMHVRGKVIWLRGRPEQQGMGIQFTGVMGEVLAELVREIRKR